MTSEPDRVEFDDETRGVVAAALVVGLEVAGRVRDANQAERRRLEAALVAGFERGRQAGIQEATRRLSS